MRRLKFFFAFFLVSFLVADLSIAHAALFQNNNTSCQDEPLIDPNTGNLYLPAHSITCGHFHTPSADSDSFLDCAVGVDPTNVSATPGIRPADIAILYNKGNHSAASYDTTLTGCVNANAALVGPLKSATVFDVSPSLQSASPISVGTIIAANFIPGGSFFDDLAIVDVTHSLLLLANSDAGGGFGNDNANGGILPSSPSVNGNIANLFLPSQLQPNVHPIPVSPWASPSVPRADPSTVTLDCDGRNGPDVVVAVFVGLSANIQVLENLGTTLQNTPSSSTSLGVNVSSGSISLAVGNFGGATASPTDIAAVVGGSNPDALVICKNDGACNYSCSLPVALKFLEASLSGNDVPSSIAVGNFEGDTAEPTDLVLLLRSTGQLLYLIGNGSGGFSNYSLVSVLDSGAGASGVEPITVVTGRFNGDLASDVAVTTNQTLGGSSLAEVVVIPSNGSGGLSSPEFLHFAIPNATRASGLYAVDFDQCAGADLIALSENGSGASLTRYASVFLNANEAPASSLSGTELTIGRNVDLEIQASCHDVSGELVSYVWNQSGPSPLTFNPGSGNFSASPVNATTHIHIPADAAPGDFAFTLACTDFCGASQTVSSTATLSVNITAAVCGNGVVEAPEQCDQGSLNGASGATCSTQCTSLNVVITDQGGGCAFTPQTESTRHSLFGFVFLLSIFLLCGFRAGGLKKKFFFLFLLSIFILPFSLSSFALTSSMDVSGFRATTDPSDYFSVYSSQTQLKKGWYAGFWFDWTSEPYEVGIGSNRIRGIVDNVAIGDFLGSYALKDWITVGMDIPFVFYEGFLNPTTLVSETEGGLGDIGVNGKFRIMDPDRYIIGLSAIPFITFPTSNLASEYLGNGNFTGGFKMAVDGRPHERVILGLNLGFRFRDPFTTIGGQDIGQQMMIGLGVNTKIVDRLAFIGEFNTTTVLSHLFHGQTTPVELTGGLRYDFLNGLHANVGAGAGVNNGIGDPTVRVLAGMTYVRPPSVEKEPPPAPAPKVGEELKLSGKIYFGIGKANILPVSHPVLDKAAAYLKQHPQITQLRIEGHTCDKGSELFNQRLSQNRAEAVAAYLVKQGVSSSRLKATGFGEKMPAVPNTNEANRERNRRVQFFIEAVSK